MADLLSMLMAAAGNQGAPTNTELYAIGSGAGGGLDNSLNAATATNDVTVVKPTLYYGPWNTWSKNGIGDSSGQVRTTFLVKEDGSLWCLGQDSSGSSGLNAITTGGSNILFPVKVGTNTDWLNAKIAVGSSFAIAVKSNGTLWAWGSSNDGKLGNDSGGTAQNKSSPIQIGALTDWLDVTAGPSFWIAKKTDGTLWACGLNDYGQLGLNDRVSRSSPVQVGALTNWNGSSIVAGYRTSFVVKSDGTLWGWGENTLGNIGTNNRIDRSSPVQIGALTNWSKVYSAAATTHAIKTDGTLWAWGRNTYGQLGTNNLTNRSSPVQVGALTNWKDIFVLLDNTTNGTTQIAGIESGKLYEWGFGGWITTTDRSSPVQVGSRTDWVALINTVFTSNIFISKSNPSASAILGFYTNKNTPISFASGFTSNDGNYVFPAVQAGFPVRVESESDWISAGSGYYCGFGIKSDNTLWAWGDNTTYQLGTNSGNNCSSPIQVGALTDWSKVFGARGFNANTTFAVKTDGTLWAWGSNSQGKIGNNIASVATYSSPIQIGALTDWKMAFSNNDASIFLRTNGTMWSCGLNSDGILGINSGSATLRRSSPTQIGTGTDWNYISLGITGGVNNAAAIKTDGTLWTWGKNDGELGLNNRVNRSSPTQVGALTNWSKIIMGRSVIALKTDGTLWTWGNNEYGKLGINLSYSGANLSRSSPVQVGALTNWTDIAQVGDAMYALNSDNDLYSWGLQSRPYSPAGWDFASVNVSYSSPVQIANIKLTEMASSSSIGVFLKSNV